jgi:tRNA(adenine34) deaminase
MMKPAAIPTANEPLVTAMMTHEHYMRVALDDAAAAGREGNRPVGSLIVRGGEILAKGRNTVTIDFDPSAHAEVAALRVACRSLKTIDLSGATLYSTLEPCPMCLWAMLEAKVSKLVLGGRYESIGGFHLGRYNVEAFLEFADREIDIVTGVLQRECEAVRIDWMKARGLL